MKTFMRMALTTLVSLGIAVGVAWADAKPGFKSREQNKDLVKAAGFVEQEKFKEAIPLLKRVIAAEPENADAYNYLGFSHRKLGAKDEALVYYLKALELEPQHRGANEYLGELYLEMGDLKRAEERLDVLDGACFFGCEEYTELKEAIEAYKAKNGS